MNRPGVNLYRERLGNSAEEMRFPCVITPILDRCKRGSPGVVITDQRGGGCCFIFSQKGGTYSKDKFI